MAYIKCGSNIEQFVPNSGDYIVSNADSLLTIQNGTSCPTSPYSGSSGKALFIIWNVKGYSNVSASTIQGNIYGYKNKIGTLIGQTSTAGQTFDISNYDYIIIADYAGQNSKQYTLS